MKVITTFDKLLSENKYKLTKRQFIFCEEYLQHYDSMRAYKEAFACSDKTDHQARIASYKMLERENVKKYIIERRALSRQLRVMDTERVVDEIMACAFTNISDLIDHTTSAGEPVFRNIEDLTPEQQKAIKKISYVENETKFGTNRRVTFEMHDKKGMLEMLCKYLDLYKDNPIIQNNLQINNYTQENSIEVDPKTLTDEQLELIIKQHEAANGET
jgi:hypothetical protein